MVLKHYVIVRDDLPIGTMAAMVVHAAGITGGASAVDAHAVVLKVPSAAAIAKLSNALQDAGITHHVVSEPDTPWNGQLMAIGLPPTETTPELRAITRRLRLLS